MKLWRTIRYYIDIARFDARPICKTIKTHWCSACRCDRPRLDRMVAYEQQQRIPQAILL
jgi:hypothetical protein